MMRSIDGRKQPTATILLTERELRTLVRLSDYYLSLKPLRMILRYLAPPKIRVRVSFVVDESKWLKFCARAARDELRTGGESERPVSMTIPALIAFWGRLLASLREKRSRRKLSANEYERREDMSRRFEEAVRTLLVRHRHQVERMLETRRPVEQIWMRECLGIPLHDDSE